MAYYQRHIFFCINRREEGDRPCCYDAGGEQAFAYAKQKAKEMDLLGPGKLRVNKSGCLDRCEEGPVAVVYPEGVWYSYVDREDIDEIIEEHLVNGRPVERLKI
ncbi:MAG: (2Fe-2S) ferredoxin domain-containing protein [Gammaproteobacteria bacterium]